VAKIAEMGSTDADRVKLHFEIRRQGKPVDPAVTCCASVGKPSVSQGRKPRTFGGCGRRVGVWPEGSNRQALS
jgi:murein DD-endopeptidase MepM/ murein hydrolase activator NlpD